SVLCSTSLSPVDDLGSLSIDQIAQLGLSSLQVIYYSEQLFSNGETGLHPRVLPPVTQLRDTA
ncbi:hypothetical protein, partial [Symbiopectobacterium sp.]|uniref:hypothetical protein n=1 Tax=Symbiopectobacterium sp. TaxID=2952789 RepID=UPI003F2F4AC3